METRKQIEQEITDYLKGVGVSDRKVLDKAVSIIKRAANRAEELNDDLLRNQKTKQCAEALGLGVGDLMYVGLTWNFAPRHYHKLESFVKRYEAILEEEDRQEEAVAKAIYKEVFEPLKLAGIDEDYDGLGCPDFVVIVYGDRIEVKAYEPGVGEKIPRQGRKYIGDRHDIRWRYPVSALSVLKSLNRPVITVNEVNE